MANPVPNPVLVLTLGGVETYVETEPVVALQGQTTPPSPPDVGQAILYYSSTSDSFSVIDSNGTLLLNTASTPVINTRLDLINATTPESITATAAIQALYAVSVYLKSLGTASAGHVVDVTITYITPDDGVLQTITLALPLSTSTIVMETYPLFCKAGTAISIFTSYAGGATNDPYTLSLRLVQMP